MDDKEYKLLLNKINKEYSLFVETEDLKYLANAFINITRLFRLVKFPIKKYTQWIETQK